MRIGLIAPPWVEVPPPSYGGTETVIDTLARALEAAGHDVVLYATGDSTCAVTRRWVYPHAVVPMGWTAFEVRHVQAAYESLADLDVIHDHTTMGPVWAAARRDLPPVVSTVHTPFTPEARELCVQLATWGVVLVSISRSQRDSAPEVPVARVIHHGVDASRVTPGDGSGGYALFVGRCAPEKGVHDAIEIARRAGLPLRIAAKMREPEERAYFEQWIEPELGPAVVFLGEIGADQRDRELAGAISLLNPIAWTEPFGMVMIEAMACGTPVIAYPNGAAPEIVDDGETGFLVSGVDEAVRALRDVRSLDRQACLRAVRGHFSGRRMADDYIELYRSVLDRRRGAVEPDGRATTREATQVVDLRERVGRAPT